MAFWSYDWHFKINLYFFPFEKWKIILKSSDLPILKLKKTCIGLFYVLGNLEHFIIIVYFIFEKARKFQPAGPLSQKFLDFVKTNMGTAFERA